MARKRQLRTCKRLRGGSIPGYTWISSKNVKTVEVDGKKKKMFTNIPFDLKKIQPEAVWNGVLHQDSEWAFVKPHGAKIAMRECYKDYGRFKGQAKKLKERCILFSYSDPYFLI